METVLVTTSTVRKTNYSTELELNPGPIAV